MTPPDALVPQPVPQVASDHLLIQTWLHGRSPHTQRAYLADVQRLLAGPGAGKSLRAITIPDLQSFAQTLDHLAPASRYRTLAAIKSLLAFGFQVGYLPFDAGRMLRLPPVKNQLAGRILVEGDVHRLLQAEPMPRNRILLALLYASAIRVGELCALCWNDLQPNGQSGQISVFGKGGSTRSVLLPASIWKQLQELRGHALPTDPVFRSRKQGRALLPGAVREIVKRAAARAGIDQTVSPHWLRHAHASHALDRGAPIHLVQATLGHASLATTGRYLHARPKESSGGFLDAIFFAVLP